MTLYAPNSTITTAEQVQECFRQFDRDSYPLPVYQFILEAEQEYSGYSGQSRELDVIAWCCDLDESLLDECDIDEHGDLDGLAEHLSNYTTIVYIDHEAQIIYHLAY